MDLRGVKWNFLKMMDTTKINNEFYEDVYDKKDPSKITFLKIELNIKFTENGGFILNTSINLELILDPVIPKSNVTSLIEKYLINLDH